MKKARAVFSVQDLRVERDAVILHHVNWRVESGQHWVMLGANGSGKTSLLSALTGYLTPSCGEIQIGRARFGASDWREVRTAVGLVSSSLSHHIEPGQTARDVIHSGLDAQINFWARPSSRQLRKSDRMLDHVHAAHLADRPWRHLSQGERQRILIGRALIAGPRLLFLDEPCAGLDPVAREDFLGFLDKIGRKPEAPSLVLVTHHVEEIVPVFTHVLLLSRGTLLDAGTKEAMLTSRLLSETFGASIKLRRAQNRYRLETARRGTSFSP